MKIKDHINKSINHYPSLYMVNDYEESSFTVLHHCFIVLGNGTEWAYTGDRKTGGYLTDPVYNEIDNEWVRIKDKPYGEEKHELDPRTFKEDIFYFGEINQEDSSDIFLSRSPSDRTVFESELNKLTEQYNVCINCDKYIKGFHTHWYLKTKAYSSRNDDPYPNFSKRFSCFWEIDPELIQEDWRLAGIDHLEYWQKYFNDGERVKSYHYYKNPESLKKHITSYYKNRSEKYDNWVQSVRDDYEFQEFDGENFEEMSSIRWERELLNTKKFLSETLERLNI